MLPTIQLNLLTNQATPLLLLEISGGVQLGCSFLGFLQVALAVVVTTAW